MTIQEGEMGRMLQPSIKMRVNKKGHPMCNSCGCGRKAAVEMFDVCIGEDIFCLCNFCMETLFNKSLKATVQVQGKLKSQEDLKITQARKRSPL